MTSVVEILCWLALAVAALPCLLSLANLPVYRRLKPAAGAPPGGPGNGVSVLIPARNEAANIRQTLQAVLASRAVNFEVVVLDDGSTDGTGGIVLDLARRDARLRLEQGPPLPAGWCGKQHACHILAQRANHPWLVFLDADVRLAPDALSRMLAFMKQSGAALASGIPRQETRTFSERLLIPLIHFVMIGFLPMWWARRNRSAAFGAGCGQLFIASAEAYFRVGGHAAIRASLHDGIKLPRAFRRAGFATELFDATDLAVCRMYRTNSEVWRGLAKNATEGLAAPRTIAPMTFLLFGGQVMPFLLAAATAGSQVGLAGLALAAVVLSLLPRVLAAWRFRQPFASAMLHPIGVLALLYIQWAAWLRRRGGSPSHWKGRAYTPEPSEPGSHPSPSVLPTV